MPRLTEEHHCECSTVSVLGYGGKLRAGGLTERREPHGASPPQSPWPFRSFGMKRPHLYQNLGVNKSSERCEEGMGKESRSETSVSYFRMKPLTRLPPSSVKQTGQRTVFRLGIMTWPLMEVPIDVTARREHIYASRGRAAVEPKCNARVDRVRCLPRTRGVSDPSISFDKSRNKFLI